MPEKTNTPSASEELDSFLAQTQNMGNDELKEAAISLATTLGIDEDTFSGRERDAIQTLVGLGAYYQLGQREREAVFAYTHSNFEANPISDLNRPEFMQKFRTTAALQLVQPAWFKTNVSNTDLKENAIFWGIIKVIVNIMTAAPGSAYGAGKAVAPNSEAIKRTDALIKKIFDQTKDLRNVGKIGSFSAPGLFLSLCVTIAVGRYSEMMKEVELRIDRKQMTSADRRDIQKEIKDRTFGLSEIVL
ncbi:hypothetical protein [Agrobacterium vitis]|uniref:hypothetical protein n=1 Tax=Agrobacterium vitis TaxID=373 RepID=UPI0008720BB7|nr:hypothetical protein [Agrobacterium vitis]MCE6074087.1 hypothetical protein [Agrobacterium vitis]MCM2453162.1 hypothetical protein [Agrobacterium vitis]MCM2468917.1 hypothetical protein [Agrobacterium vitis]MUO71290.1 hypothetical protein [Agrobacterium vitis]MUO85047.1 hypothetical protein [Agrobacterium vitis]